MTDRGAASPRTDLDAIEASLARQVGLTTINFGPGLWRERDPLLGRAVDALARLRAAQEAPAPEGLRVMGLGLDEIRRAIDTADYYHPQWRAAPPTPAEPPHPDALGYTGRTTQSWHHESGFDRAEARPPEGLDADRLARALRWAGVRAEPDFATIEDAARQVAADYDALPDHGYARLSAGGATKP